MGNKGQVKYHRIAPFLWVIEMIFLDPFHLSVRLKHRFYLHSGQTFSMIVQRVDEQSLVLFFEISNYL